MFKGGGIALAETLVKKSSEYLLTPSASAETEVTGLSCRWQPIKSRNGTMLTLLVMELPSEQPGKAYDDIQHQLDIIFSGKDSSPVRLTNLRYHWPARGLKEEAGLVYHDGTWVRLVRLYGFTLFFYLLNRFNLRIKQFDATRYREEIILNSDYQKFNDMLRMVMDCSQEQAENVNAALKSLHHAGRIVYGIHRSDCALMTCFVTSIAGNGHVHFIDGDEGGYAMAAVQLKQQLAQAL